MTCFRAALVDLPTAGIPGSCAGRPAPVASPWLDGGVTSSFGGGTQGLGNPDVGVATRTR